jgi:hypothetical protein
MRGWVGVDLVAEGEAGAEMAGLCLVELVAERGRGLRAPGRGERAEPDEQFAVTGADVAGDGQCLADQRVGLVADTGRSAPSRERATDLGDGRAGPAPRPVSGRRRAASSLDG